MQSIGARPYWITVAAGLVLRLAIAPWGGHPGDLAALAGWAAALGEHGLLAVYATSDANYPPLALAILGASHWIYQLLGGGELAGPLWWVLLKLPAILADLGIVLLVGRLASWKHRSPWLAAGLVFNPVMIYLSAWWGQAESLYMLGALAALVATVEHYPFWAGLSLGLGVMVKLQAAVIAPMVVLVALLETRNARGLLRLSIGVVLPVALVLGPFAWTGQGELVAQRLVAVIAAPGWPTVNALNAWYLLTGGGGNWAYNTPLTWPDTAPVIGGISARAMGASMLVVWTAAVLALVWRQRTRYVGTRDSVSVASMWGAAMLYLGLFLWPTQAHERYVFGAVVLLAGAAAAGMDTIYRVPTRLLYIVMTAACTLNLMWAAPFSAWLEGWLTGERTAGSMVALMFMAAAVYGIWQIADS